MNRRDKIDRLVPRGVIVQPPMGNEPGTETPVMALFREWKAAFDRANCAAGLSDDEFETENAKVTCLVERMMSLPATDARDVCAKLTAFTYDGEFFVDDDGTMSGPMLAEARALIGGAQ